VRRRPTRVGEILGQLLPTAAPTVRVLDLGRIWPLAVGDAIARETWPARLGADGVLVVHCSSAVWAAELELLAPQLQERLAAAAAELAPAGLRFRVGPLPPPPPTPSASPPLARSARSRAVASELAGPIADDDLRAAAERAISGYLSRSERPVDSA